MMSIYCPSWLFSRFSTVVDGSHQWPWSGVDGYINVIQSVNTLRSKIHSLTILEHLFHALSNLSVGTPANTKPLFHSPEQKGTPPPNTGQGRL
ncbi:hypothetical protein QL285_000136 [Trifolium repens]|nr:hypothetical protein QL285_000136 [Trifolium repens]